MPIWSKSESLLEVIRGEREPNVLTIAPKQNEIAKRYGGVLFDLAQKEGVLGKVFKDVTDLHQCLIAEPQEWRRIVSPTTPSHLQSTVIEKLAKSLKLGKLTTYFLKVVCQNHRLQNLGFILESFKARYKEAEGIVEGIIETPFKLPQKNIETLHTMLKQQLHKNIELRQEINENILGGLVLRIGSLMIDTSVKAQLHELRQRMKG